MMTVLLVMMMVLNLLMILMFDGVARVGGGLWNVTLGNAGDIGADNVDSGVG